MTIPVEKQPSVYAALAAVMADVRAVGKDGWNDHNKFKFRGIDAVMDAVGPALRKHGVVATPHLEKITYEVVTTTKDKAQTACRVIVKYIFTGPAGDTIQCVVPGEAWDSSDKATAKAMSVAYRTALIQALCLPTGEPDPDSYTYERTIEDEEAAESTPRFAERPVTPALPPGRQALRDTSEKLGRSPEDVMEQFFAFFGVSLQQASDEQCKEFANVLLQEKF